VAQSGSAPGWGPGGRRFKSCLPDEKSQDQNLAPRREDRRKPRKRWDSGSLVLVCSRLCPARGAARGPQRRAKGTASDELRHFMPDVKRLEPVGYAPWAAADSPARGSPVGDGEPCLRRGADSLGLSTTAKTTFAWATSRSDQRRLLAALGRTTRGRITSDLQIPYAGRYLIN
jgi:hypothetical protein